MTVVEIAVALSILSIGLLSMAALLPVVKRDLTQSNQRTDAVFLAERSAEWLHGLSYSDSVLDAGTWVQDDFADGYDRSWTVQENVPIAGVKTITVSVTKAGADSSSAVVTLLVSEAGN